LSSRDFITNPRNKRYPNILRPWIVFTYQHRLTFCLLNNAFPTESCGFKHRDLLAGLGDRVSQSRISDEQTLEYFLHNSVEDSVRIVIEKFREVEKVTAAFDIGDGVVFENHAHAVSDTAEEVIERGTASTLRTPDHRRDLNQLRPVQILAV
ncbi:hypothetical protein IWW34DRAFT_637955, partial [Fusarium oxysporum f. sp. albedinis]